MSSILNQLGLLLAGRRPGFPGARTPAWNPAQPNPYPNAGGQPEDPEEEAKRQVASDEPNRPWYKSIYDGLINNPAGTAFTLAMANSLTAPKRPGQTGMGQWTEGVAQGYNALTALSQMRAQAAAAARKEGREQQELDIKQQAENRQQGEAHQTGLHQERQDEIAAGRASEAARHNKAAETADKEERSLRRTEAANRAKEAEQRFNITMKRLDNAFALNKQQGEDLKTYRQGMLTVAQQNAQSSAKQATAALIRAKAEEKALAGAYTPEQVAQIMRIAADRAQNINEQVFIGGDKTEVTKVIDSTVADVIDEFDKLTKRPTGPAQTPQGPAKPGASGAVRWGRDAKGNPVRLGGQ